MEARVLSIMFLAPCVHWKMAYCMQKNSAFEACVHHDFPSLIYLLMRDQMGLNVEVMVRSALMPVCFFWVSCVWLWKQSLWGWLTESHFEITPNIKYLNIISIQTVKNLSMPPQPEESQPTSPPDLSPSFFSFIYIYTHTENGPGHFCYLGWLQISICLKQCT